MFEERKNDPDARPNRGHNLIRDYCPKLDPQFGSFSELCPRFDGRTPGVGSHQTPLEGGKFAEKEKIICGGAH